MICPGKAWSKDETLFVLLRGLFSCRVQSFMAVVLSRYRAFSRWIRFQLMMQCSAAIVSIVLLRNDIIMLPSTRSVVLVFLNLPFQRRFNCDYFPIVISTRHSSLISCETLSKLVLSFAMRWICFTEIFAYETEEMAEEPEDLSELKFLPKTRKKINRMASDQFVVLHV